MSNYPAPVVELHEGRNKNSYKLNLGELKKILGQADVVGKKVAVISIAGAFRKGKSFLLNFLVTYLEWLEAGGQGEWFDEETRLDKFHWRGGCDRDTNGIFLWSKPYILENQKGEEIVVLLMDTQGTFDHQSTVKECATIFALSTLLSSVQIFNLSSQIQEDDLSNLRLFTEYAQLARGGNQENSLAPFQKLLFLVRDWPNSEDHSYGYEGGEEYLEKILKTTPKQKKELQNLRKNLKNSFDSLLCFLLPHPGLRIARNNSEKVLGKVEPEFEEQLDFFVPSLFGDVDSPLEAKTINGKAITCGELLELFKAYMAIFNSDDLPEAKSILDATVDAVNMAAEQRAREKYDEIMKQKFTSTLSCRNILAKFHEEAKAESLKIFESRPKLGEELAAKGNKQNLKEYYESRYMDYRKTVEQNIRLEEKKKQMQEEQARERRRIKQEEERIRTEKLEQEAILRRQREEQERKKREAEEELKRQKEQHAEQMRREREEQERRRREEEWRLQREREEQERRRRQEEERLRKEREELQRKEAEQMRKAEAEQERIRRLEEQMREREARSIAAMSSYLSSGPSFGGSSYSSGSPSSSRDTSGSSNIRSETYTTSRGNQATRYRDMNTGRFCKNPNK